MSTDIHPEHHRQIGREEKESLLEHLKKQHGDDSSAKPSKMTLSRKKKSTLTMGSGSKAKSVQVEVRKKRTYVKRSELEEQQMAEAEAKAAEEAAAKAAEEAEAKAIAEAKEAENAKAAAAARAEAEAERKAQAKAEAEAKAKQASQAKAKNIEEAQQTPVKAAESDEAKALRLQQEAEAAAKKDVDDSWTALGAEIAKGVAGNTLITTDPLTLNEALFNAEVELADLEACDVTCLEDKLAVEQHKIDLIQPSLDFVIAKIAEITVLAILTHKVSASPVQNA